MDGLQPLAIVPAAAAARAAARGDELPGAEFPPTRAAALARLAAIDIAAYERSRNHLEGAVTRLSPYLTHGVVSVPEVIDSVLARGAHERDKIVFELGWREYWQHAWRHLGEAIFRSTRAEPARPECYDVTVPADVIEARSGVPAIDAAVRALYATGYVHNHARMWLASYLVHVRKVRWQAGAAWLHGHLLDGDLASNSLSWQWVAGTFSSKPYLFNNDNVARYAPALACAGTAIDASYEALERLARSPEARGPEPDAPARGVPVPGLALAPPLLPTDPLPELAGRRVALVHPWMLSQRPDCDVAIGVLHLPYHRRFPWSARRWSFVLALMRPLVDRVWVGDIAALRPALADAREVSTLDTLSPGYREALARVATRVQPVPRYFPDPPRLMRSFSQWWAACGPGRLPAGPRRT
jgi:deoxyribodipyrimidine photo-lyase